MPDEPIKTGELVLAEHIAEKEIQREDVKNKRAKILDAGLIAMVACYRAAESGNVTCRQAVVEIEKLILDDNRTKN